jgi:hypothetical protein
MADSSNTPSKNDQPEVPGTQPQEKKHSLGARIILALAFSTVGAKLGLFGTLADGAKLLGGEGSFGSKVRGLPDKLTSEVIKHLPQDRFPTNGEVFKAYGKVFKFTLIITTVASIAGLVLGWVRGGRIEHAKDILLHPIRSTKLVLGIGTKSSEPQTEAQSSSLQKTDPSKETAENSTYWQNKITQPDQRSAAIKI